MVDDLSAENPAVPFNRSMIWSVMSWNLSFQLFGFKLMLITKHYLTPTAAQTEQPSPPRGLEAFFDDESMEFLQQLPQVLFKW